MANVCKILKKKCIESCGEIVFGTTMGSNVLSKDTLTCCQESNHQSLDSRTTALLTDLQLPQPRHTVFKGGNGKAQDVQYLVF